ncbi:MAG: S8 family peptidase, partial [Firmicutes bacterium]|nr:S8 family peptidase [Bacillota bacterium]
IENMNLALVDDLWIGNKTSIPQMEPSWCEIWLRAEVSENAEGVVAELFEICKNNNISYKEQKIVFPERIVVGVNANKNQLSILQVASSRIAEIRKMATPVSFFVELSEEEQGDWVEDLEKRVDTSKVSNTSVCVLDTGVNNGHPLLSQVLKDKDMHAVDSNKGVHDKDGHGTRMAGIATYFNLEEKLESMAVIEVYHFLESVKIMDQGTDNKPELYGYITANAVSLAEIENPETNRSICMAITSPDSDIEKDGRPSSWSGAVDAITAGVYEAESEEDNRKLMFISAGNTTVDEIIETNDCTVAIINHPIEDPGQAWNAITVGAYTKKFNISDPQCEDYQAIVEPGSYSPFTSSSLYWDKKWPVKPDIVLEGGNLAHDKKTDFYSEFEDLQLLTTNKNFMVGKSFDTINMTSSATAQAAWLAANIQHQYPRLWPETIRALIIHSAEWTDVMKKKILGNGTPKRSDYRRLLRICGYGVPDLDRAIWSAENSVNLIIEDELQPFIKKASGSITSNKMHIHELPWPDDLLLELDDVRVRMKVTLSYYIEPGPGEVGWKDKYRYPSSSLLFDVNNPTEDKDNFLKRINEAIREDEEDKGEVKNDSDRWGIGIGNRNVGSIHSDIWDGTASQLSQSNYIAVYPVTGWWKTRTNLKRYNSKVRYALIVTIETPENDIDLYTIIEAKIENKVPVKTEIKAL